jgi:hypothetical protein
LVCDTNNAALARRAGPDSAGAAGFTFKTSKPARFGHGFLRWSSSPSSKCYTWGAGNDEPPTKGAS